MNHSVDFLEREYNARLSIPDHPHIFARWAEQGAAARHRRACLLDLAYGDSHAERLDLFPARKDDAPLLVFIHGGYWRSLDKSDFSWIAPPFVQHGVAVALTNYDLAPRTTIEDMVRQQLKALAWLYRHGDSLGYDPEHIIVCGHSAGAHLAVMMMAALWDAYAPDLPRTLVKGGLAISGLYDLEPLVHAPFIQCDLQLDVQRARALSPIYLPPATKAPLITSVGPLESSEFKRQTAEIERAWKKVFQRSVDAPDCNHLTIADELERTDSPLQLAALELVRASAHKGR